MKTMSLMLGLNLFAAGVFSLMAGGEAGVTIGLLLSGALLLAMFYVLMELNVAQEPCSWKDYNRAGRMLQAGDAAVCDDGNDDGEPGLVISAPFRPAAVEILLAAGAKDYASTTTACGRSVLCKGVGMGGMEAASLLAGAADYKTGMVVSAA